MTSKNLKWPRLLLLATLCLILSFGLIGCKTDDVPPSGNGVEGNGEGRPPETVVPVRVASLRGPTSIGLVNFMDKVEQSAGKPFIGDYQFSVYGTADEILPQIVSGDIDIALLPTNVAAILYNRTEGGVTVININTLGVLYIVSADDSITSLGDLKDRTVLMSGKGTTPDLVMNYLLAENYLTDRVTLEYKSEATELAAIINSDPTAIALLPEPYVTSVISKNPELAARISIADEWRQSLEGRPLVTSVTVVRTEFLAEYPDVVDEFLSYHRLSVDVANLNAATTAQLVVHYGIMDDAAVVEQAIPRCYLVCLTGEDMRTAAELYLGVIFEADPAQLGGSLPGDDFYYLGG